MPNRLVSVLRGDEQRLVASRGTAPFAGVVLDLAGDPLGRGWGTAAEDHADELGQLRAALQRLRESLHERAAGAPMSARDLADLAAMGYGGHGEALEGEAGDGSRLVMDGGVWADE